MGGPLEGIKVLDFTHYGVGPWACTLLGQLGAEVTKIEPPEGDHLSEQPPPYKNGITAAYIAVNLNKTCATVDLRDEAAREAVTRLVAQADVVVENHRPGYMDRRGLGYEDVARINPRAVYCSSSGYGSRGPYRDMASTDPFGQAVSGFASVSGPTGGPPEGVKGGSPADLSTSIYIVAGILAGLYRREQTGHGQTVEISQMQASIALTTSRAAEYFATGVDPVPEGSGIAHAVPSRAYRAADGKYVSISALDDSSWVRLLQALDPPELATDPRFASNASRVEHRTELDALLEAAVSGRPSAELFSLLESHEVPCGPLLTYNELRIHPQVKALEMLKQIDTPWGSVRVGGLPWRFSRTPGSITRTRRPGEDTDEILARGRSLSPAVAVDEGSVAAPSAMSGDGRSARGGPLVGLRVVDLTQGYVGYCGMLFADLGAEVLKVEPPEGDYLRRLGPPFIADDSGADDSAAFAGANRGKKGIVLDWRVSAADRERLEQLVDGADILLSDLYPDEAESLGLDYESLGRVHPNVIYCAITPFGDEGPYRNRRATELEIQGMAGDWRYLGSLKEAPLRIGVPFAAITSSILAFQGAVAALLCRLHTGEAQKVSVSQLGCLLSMQTIMFCSESEPDEWIGHCLAVYRSPARGLKTKDRAVLWGFMDGQSGFRSFYARLGLSQLLDDARLGSTDVDRREQERLMGPVLEDAMKDKTVDEVIALVKECGGHAVPYHTFSSLSRDLQAIEMGMIAEASHPIRGPMETIGLPWEFSESQPRLVGAPLLGEHTDEVLDRLASVMPH